MNRRSFLAASAVASAAVPALAEARAARDGETMKVLVRPMRPEVLAELQAVAPGVELVACRNEAEAAAHIATAHGLFGFESPDLIRAGKNLRWVQAGSAGVEKLMEITELVEGPAVVTNMQRAFGPPIADQAMGFLLAFTRDLGPAIRDGANTRRQGRGAGPVLDELNGKTMLIIGMGGIGSEIARRAYAFGCHVLATDPKVLDRPLFVEELHRPDKFSELLPRADIVVSAVPLTKRSTRMIDAAAFAKMKTGVVLINVSRGKVVDTEALVAALNTGKVSAAGLDVTDPEPLPADHPLRSQNVIVTPHNAGRSPGSDRRRHEIFRENLRRLSAGESLLNVVDKKVGY